MPTRDDEEPRGRPLLKLLFWAGIGLAPLAMGLLLIADGNGPLRIAAVLAVLSVVLIGLSIGLRGDTDSVRADLEDLVADEIDELQSDVRRDIETAARATHRSLGEKVQALQQTVDALRAQLEAQRGAARPAAAGIPAQPGTAAGYGGAPAREGATYGRGEPTTYGREPAAATYGREAGGREPAAATYGREAGGREPAAAGFGREPAAAGFGPESAAAGFGREAGGREPAAAGYGREPGAAGATYGRDSAGRGYDSGYGREAAADDEPAMASSARTYGAPADGRGAATPPRARTAGGVVRHTETVQVTTRHTVVDGRGGYGTGDIYADSGPDYRSAGTYGGRRGQDESPAAPTYESYAGRRSRADDEPPGSWTEPRPAGDREESFTDRRLRELRGDRPAIERDADPVYADQWSSARAGDRWASVRADDRGRELRVGERRASVRADESGTEYRIEDRWAAVRRDDERASGGAGGRGPDAWYADAWSGSQANSGGSTYGTGGSTYGTGGSAYGSSRDEDRDEWSSSRALPAAENDWRRGDYEEDDRGGDDRWR
ncbi:hypothetical protein AB0J74_06705 [Asanoa sp. NPDC049573]|uniref:hypothetical protein n=1 Tax=Asanoa sp. NPDC049573 TaxID=3155396 RepID=UPI00342F4445